MKVCVAINTHVIIITSHTCEYFNMYFIAIVSLSHKNSCYKYLAGPGICICSMLSQFIFEGEQDQIWDLNLYTKMFIILLFQS